MQVFHDVEERAVLGPPVVVDLHGVRVRQPGGRADLVLEPFQRPGVAGTLRPDHLEGAGSLQQPMLGEVDLSHPPGPDLVPEAVLIELPGLARPDVHGADEVGAVSREQGRRSPGGTRSRRPSAPSPPGVPGGTPRGAPGTGAPPSATGQAAIAAIDRQARPCGAGISRA